MLTKRIIPCLDIKDGRVVKGVSFVSLQDCGDPVSIAQQYEKDGADELVFLDITATNEKRKTLVDLVARIACGISIPFTVGGGITSIEAMDQLFTAGADKISLNSVAVKNPWLITQASQKFGKQAIVIAIDYKATDVYIGGGKQKTDKELFSRAKECAQLGAGELLCTSIADDGQQAGFDILTLQKIAASVSIPVIASGGCGSEEDFLDLFSAGIPAGLAASVFHYGKIRISGLKKYLAAASIPVRLV